MYFEIMSFHVIFHSIVNTRAAKPDKIITSFMKDQIALLKIYILKCIYIINILKY